MNILIEIVIFIIFKGGKEMGIYRLAICEDDDSIRKELCSLCHEILIDKEIEHEIQDFSSAIDLEKKLIAESHPFDLLLLDIQMEGMTGMELARTLRKRGDRVSVIFVSGCEDYLVEGYEVQPVHFLLKPIRRDALENALRVDWELNHKSKSILLRVGSKNVSILLNQICYIESYNHDIIVHLEKNEEKTFSFSLSRLENQLPSDQFCRCHNSYLVNLAYVEEITRSSLTLRGGSKIPIGRTYYKTLQQAFIQYMNK